MMSPPIIYSKCCKSLIGCENCVNLWYGTGPDGINKACPVCNTVRALADTSRICGLDQMLEGVREAVVSSDDV